MVGYRNAGSIVYMRVLKSVDWESFFRMVHCLGDELNSKKNRFDKADILENALALMSNENIKWVDAVGWDHEAGRKKIEMKSQRFSLKTKTGKLKNNVSNIKLMNSLGSAKGRRPSDVIRFDILLIVDTGNDNSYSVGYINGAEDTITDYLDFKTDGVVLKNFPMSKVKFVYDDSQSRSLGISQNNANFKSNKNSFSYSNEKRKMQEEFIKGFI